jgi:hypothetical protein
MDRPQQQRPRSKSTFSFKSHKSNGSHNTDHDKKSHHQRTSSKDHEHKQHLGGTTKADPNSAMNELQPGMSLLLDVCWDELRILFRFMRKSGSVV